MACMARSFSAGYPPSAENQRVSVVESLSDRYQFFSSLHAGFGISHLQTFKQIDDDLGNDQSRVLLVVRWDDVPGRMMRARRAQTLLERRHIVRPEFSLVDIGKAEFPVLLGRF
jgi:hypothetical protein